MSVLKNTMKKIGHRASLSDMMGQTYPIYAYTGTNYGVFSSLHRAFCGSWRQGILK